MPPGLIIRSSLQCNPKAQGGNGNDIVICGTPTQAGTYEFSLTVTDSAQPPVSATVHSAITISNP